MIMREVFYKKESLTIKAIFGKSKRTKRSTEIVDEMADQIDSDENPDAYRVISLAKKDLDKKRQAASVVANKLSNSLYMRKIEKKPELPSNIKPLVGELKSLISANGYGMVMTSVPFFTAHY